MHRLQVLYMYIRFQNIQIIRPSLLGRLHVKADKMVAIGTAGYKYIQLWKHIPQAYGLGNI